MHQILPTATDHSVKASSMYKAIFHLSILILLFEHNNFLERTNFEVNLTRFYLKINILVKLKTNYLNITYWNFYTKANLNFAIEIAVELQLNGVILTVLLWAQNRVIQLLFYCYFISRIGGLADLSLLNQWYPLLLHHAAYKCYANMTPAPFAHGPRKTRLWSEEIDWDALVSIK